MILCLQRSDMCLGNSHSLSGTVLPPSPTPLEVSPLVPESPTFLGTLWHEWGLAVIWLRVEGTGDPYVLAESPGPWDGGFLVEVRAVNKEALSQVLAKVLKSQWLRPSFLAALTPPRTGSGRQLAPKGDSFCSSVALTETPPGTWPSSRCPLISSV